MVGSDCSLYFYFSAIEPLQHAFFGVLGVCSSGTMVRQCCRPMTAVAHDDFTTE